MSASGRSPFRGSLVALPTPFRGGQVDFPALRRLIELQIEGRSDGLVAAGSTGEAATLSAHERLSVIEFCAGVAGGRTPVIAGVGSSDTRLCCELAEASEGAGADGLLASTPPYNRPTQRGLARHFGAVAGVSSLPLVLYNIPSRTGVDLLPETVGAIAAANPTVVAIKESSPSIERVSELVALDAVEVLLGEDAWIADGIQLGAVGVVGVVANLVPARVAELVNALLSGDTARAPALVESIAPLVKALFLETNPAPLKAALEMLGLCTGELRLPLVPIETETRVRLRVAMERCGLLG